MVDIIVDIELWRCFNRGLCGAPCIALVELYTELRV